MVAASFINVGLALAADVDLIKPVGKVIKTVVNIAKPLFPDGPLATAMPGLRHATVSSRLPNAGPKDTATPTPSSGLSIYLPHRYRICSTPHDSSRSLFCMVIMGTLGLWSVGSCQAAWQQI